jgi:hypothetical protein
MSLNFAVCNGTQIYRCVLLTGYDHASLNVLLHAHTVSLYIYCACGFWYALCNF